MPDHTASDLEKLKTKAKVDKVEKRLNDPNAIRPDDAMLVLRKEELDLIEDLMYEVLQDDKRSVEHKKVALGLIKHLSTS